MTLCSMRFAVAARRSSPRRISNASGSALIFRPPPAASWPNDCATFAAFRKTNRSGKSQRGFVVRDLPRTEAELRKYPQFEFENWAVIALGGIPNKVQVGDMGVDGRIYPVSSAATPRKKQEGELALKERWYPIQVKQKDKVGRPDIDSFEAMMMREDCDKGFFVAFDYSSDAMTEIGQFFKRTGKIIIAPSPSAKFWTRRLARKLA